MTRATTPPATETRSTAANSKTAHTVDARRVNVVLDVCNEDGEIDVCLQRESDVGYFAIIPGTGVDDESIDGALTAAVVAMAKATPEYATGLLFAQAPAMADLLRVIAASAFASDKFACRELRDEAARILAAIEGQS